jgi:hypothetical protein
MFKVPPFGLRCLLYLGRNITERKGPPHTLKKSCTISLHTMAVACWDALSSKELHTLMCHVLSSMLHEAATFMLPFT